ncbi:SHOCT domain-containing protein, partial [Kibdelosporangium lantanae]
MPAEMPRLHQMLRPDEPLLLAVRAGFDDRNGLAAITGTRLLLIDKAFLSDEVVEIPLTSIGTMGTEQQFLTNALVLRLHSGQPVRLINIDDIDAFTDTLRDAIQRATTPVPPSTAPNHDILDQIAKLADLHAAGVLTDDEFQTKKTELLNRL